MIRTNQPANELIFCLFLVFAMTVLPGCAISWRDGHGDEYWVGTAIIRGGEGYASRRAIGVTIDLCRSAFYVGVVNIESVDCECAIGPVPASLEESRGFRSLTVERGIAKVRRIGGPAMEQAEVVGVFAGKMPDTARVGLGWVRSMGVTELSPLSSVLFLRIGGNDGLHQVWGYQLINGRTGP
jgi:hypothetical protein